jgi:hypothetical protein
LQAEPGILATYIIKSSDPAAVEARLMEATSNGGQQLYDALSQQGVSAQPSAYLDNSLLLRTGGQPGGAPVQQALSPGAGRTAAGPTAINTTVLDPATESTPPAADSGSSNSTTTATTSSGDDTNVAAIVGGVVGGVVGLALLGALLFYCRRRRKQKRAADTLL